MADDSASLDVPPAWFWIVIVLGLIAIGVMIYMIRRWRRSKQRQKEFFETRENDLQETLIEQPTKRIRASTMGAMETPLVDFESHTLGFRVSYPAHWTKETKELGDTVVVQFTSPMTESSYKRFRVVVQEVPWLRCSTDQMSFHTVRSIIEDETGSTLVSEKSATSLPGAREFVYIVRDAQSDSSVRFNNLLIKVDRFVYTATFSCGNENAESLAKLAQRLMETFQLIRRRGKQHVPETSMKPEQNRFDVMNIPGCSLSISLPREWKLAGTPSFDFEEDHSSGAPSDALGGPSEEKSSSVASSLRSTSTLVKGSLNSDPLDHEERIPAVNFQHFNSFSEPDKRKTGATRAISVDEVGLRAKRSKRSHSWREAEAQIIKGLVEPNGVVEWTCDRREKYYKGLRVLWVNLSDATRRERPEIVTEFMEEVKGEIERREGCRFLQASPIPSPISKYPAYLCYFQGSRGLLRYVSVSLIGVHSIPRKSRRQAVIPSDRGSFQGEPDQETKKDSPYKSSASSNTPVANAASSALASALASAMSALYVKAPVQPKDTILGHVITFSADMEIISDFEALATHIFNTMTLCKPS